MFSVPYWKVMLITFISFSSIYHSFDNVTKPKLDNRYFQIKKNAFGINSSEFSNVCMLTYCGLLIPYIVMDHA